MSLSEGQKKKIRDEVRGMSVSGANRAYDYLELKVGSKMNERQHYRAQILALVVRGQRVPK